MVRSSVRMLVCNWLGEVFVRLRVEMKVRRYIVGVLGGLAICATAYGHHGNSAYNESTPVTLQGTVTEFDWVNPHTQIYFDVKSANGHVAHWGCETLSPGKLTRAGWSKDSVKAGRSDHHHDGDGKDGRARGNFAEAGFRGWAAIGNQRRATAIRINTSEWRQR